MVEEKKNIEKAKALIEEGKENEAFDYLSELISVESENIEALLLIGQIYINKQDFENAISNYEKIIELDPKSFDAYNRLGRIFQLKEDYETAISYSLKALEIAPTRPGCLRQAGLLHYLAKKYDLAIEYIEKAIAIEPKHENNLLNIEMYKDLAYSYWDQKNMKKLLYIMKKSLSLIQLMLDQTI